MATTEKRSSIFLREDDDERRTQERSRPRTAADGPTALGWATIVTVIIVGGLFLANTLFSYAEAREKTRVINVRIVGTVPDLTGVAVQATDLVARDVISANGEVAVLDRRDLNPFATFKAGNAGAKIGLIVGGVTTFNTGVSNCDQGNYASCVTGIISGLLLTAAGLWAPVPFAKVAHTNLTISLEQFDAASDHPAHRFIANYNEVLARNSTLQLGSRVGFVHYAKTGQRRHRLVISPRSNGIGRRQDNSDNDGGSVSYEWTDFGSTSDGHDTNSGDYDSIAGGIAGYLVDNQANDICLTQCINNVDPYEVGQLQTQAGTSPGYDSQCEFADEMVECA